MTAITMQQAAELAGVTTRTMRRWVAERRVRSFRVSPREQYVDADSLMDYLDSVARYRRDR